MKALALGPSQTAHSGIREIANLAVGMPDAIRLELGQPNFSTPAHIVEATVRALRDGFTQYTATAGLLSLRELLADKVNRVNDIAADPSQINVTIGGAGGVAAALAAVLDAGDEVLVPDPAWPNYRLALSASAARMVVYPLHAAQGFIPAPQELATLISPRTKMLIINSPCNPTGAVFPRHTVEQIVALCQENDIYLLSDECYDQIIFAGEHVSPASLCTDGRVISVFTFSKTYAMTGYRVGYVVSNSQIADTMNKILETQMSCAAAFAQKAAEAALTGTQEPVRAMVQAYRERRDLVDDTLLQWNMHTTRPEGAFYTLADISRGGMDARTFAFELLANAGVAVAPGTAFGENAAAHVRVSLASSRSHLVEGISRIGRFVKEISTAQ